MYGGVGVDEELGWKPKALPTLRAKPAMASWRKLIFLSVGKPVGLHRGCIWPKDQKPDVYFTLHCVLQIQLQATEAEKKLCLVPTEMDGRLTPPVNWKAGKHMQVLLTHKS